MKNRLLCAAALLLSCTASNKEAKPAAAAASAELGAHALVPPAPPARVEEVVETHAGITSRDPYRWMEAQGEDLTAWLHSQNTRTRSVLDRIPGRPALLDRVRTLSNSGSRITLAQRFGGRWFYFKLENGSDDKKLYTRAEGGTETLLVDPTLLGNSGQHYSPDWFQPSWDGKYVAYGISPGGSEDSTIHVIESATGKLLPDSIDRSQYAGLSWLPDSSGFFHMRLQKLARDAPPTETYRFMKVYLHRLGEDHRLDYVLSYTVSMVATVEPTLRGLGLGRRPSAQVPRYLPGCHDDDSKSGSALEPAPVGGQDLFRELRVRLRNGAREHQCADHLAELLHGARAGLGARLARRRLAEMVGENADHLLDGLGEARLQLGSLAGSVG